MKLVNTADVPIEERRSPKGRFHLIRRHISVALGSPRNMGIAHGGHPFEVELTHLPPGATNFPYHSHTAQWEVYLILSGSGQLRAADVITEIKPGDNIVCPPGEAHQITNTGSGDLVYYVIADNPPADVGFYPDTQKWAAMPMRKFFRMQEADYYEGEE